MKNIVILLIALMSFTQCTKVDKQTEHIKAIAEVLEESRKLDKNIEYFFLSGKAFKECIVTKYEKLERSRIMPFEDENFTQNPEITHFVVLDYKVEINGVGGMQITRAILFLTKTDKGYKIITLER